MRTFSSPAADISFQEYPQIKPMITAKIVMVTIMRTLLSPSSVNEAATATIRSTRTMLSVRVGLRFCRRCFLVSLFMVFLPSTFSLYLLCPSTLMGKCMNNRVRQGSLPRFDSAARCVQEKSCPSVCAQLAQPVSTRSTSACVGRAQANPHEAAASIHFSVWRIVSMA